MAWDASMAMLASPSNSTPSARFAVDTASGLKVRLWVEEVIGRRLPEGDFAAGFKDGVGLCELLNAFKPGLIAKIEHSKSPFHQMANISCFLRAIRALGVREQVMFETLDLFNENRLSQVVRCLFSLSELVRTTMPSFHGPYLAAPEKPQVDPAVLHLVDLAKGNVVPAPGWGGPVTPGAVSTASTGGGRSAVGAAGPSLSLPKNHHASNSGCLSPAAHEAGKLTYGIYEGGGVATKPPLATSPIVGRSGGQQRQRQRQPCGGGQGGAGETDSAAAETAAEALQEQLQAEEQQDDQAAAAVAAGGVGVAVAAVEYAESALPVVNTPRRISPLPTPTRASTREPTTRGGNWTRTMSSSTPTRGREADGKKGFGPGSVEEQAKRRREATARTDAEMEVALWIEGVTGETFPGKFWSSLKDGVLLCKLMDNIVAGLIRPGLPHTSRGTFPELENLSAFLSACRKVGVAEHSLFDPKDLHEKRDMQAVVRCLHVLGAAVQSTVPDFNGPFLGKRSEALSVVNARGLRKRLGKGPGARGGIHTLNVQKGGAGCEHVSPSDFPIEHPDPTATMTPAESPSAKRTSRRRDASDSAAGSGRLHAPVSPRAMAEGLCGALQPAVIMEEEAGMTTAVVRVEREGRRGARVEEVSGGGRRNLARLFASAGAGAAAPREDGAAGGPKDARVLRRGVSGASGVSGSRRRGRAHSHREEEDRGEGVVSQIQRFIEQHTKQPWRISGDLHESLRDGWQLVLLANALRPGAVRRVHNSIQPAKQVQNIANFLIASRRMGVARALLFDIEDLYENKSKTRVARTLLALRALAADPDFARARPSSLMGTSLLVTAAALAEQQQQQQQQQQQAQAPPTAATDLRR